MERARKDKLLTPRFKEREQAIRTTRAENLRRKKQQKEDKEDRAYGKWVAAAKSMEGHHIFVTAQEVEGLTTGALESNDVAVAKQLLNQIQYHQIVLQSKGEKKLFQKSSGGKLYTTEQLKDNLLSIIEANPISCGVSVPSTSNEITPTQADRFQALKKKLVERRVGERESRKIQKEKEKLHSYISSPANLEGKMINHRCQHEGGIVWFEAKVLDIVEPRVDIMQTEYNIRYTEYTNEVWTFNLLRDLKNGDLIIHD